MTKRYSINGIIKFKI